MRESAGPIFNGCWPITTGLEDRQCQSWAVSAPLPIEKGSKTGIFKDLQKKMSFFFFLLKNIVFVMSYFCFKAIYTHFYV